MKKPKLAKLELRILEALWSRGRATMREIQETFPEPRPAYTTITNTVYRMEANRAVRRVRKIGNADIFEPLVAKDVARDSLLDEILSFFGGRPQPMMAQLVESGRLTLDDIRELEKAVAETERQRKAESQEKGRKPKAKWPPSSSSTICGSHHALCHWRLCWRSCFAKIRQRFATGFG